MKSTETAATLPSERSQAPEEGHRGDATAPLQAVPGGSSDAAKTRAVLRILDTTKSNKPWFDGHGFVAGYHSVSIGGETFLGQRDSARRVAKIPLDFSGKRVLDVGCSNGGLLHHLSSGIGLGVGVDFNPKCINAANALKAANGTPNVHFYTFDLDKEDLSLLDSFVHGERVDICFILNISLWVKRWKSVVAHCATIADALIFESHGTEAEQAAQIRFVRSLFAETELLSQQSDDDPTYAQRTMYLCRKRVAQAASGDTLAAAPTLGPADDESVKAAYQACFPNAPVTTLFTHAGSREAVVVEVNGDHIVKFPLAHRGTAGIRLEQGVTELVRGRVGVQVPKISVHGHPVALARYQKLDGQLFDKHAYQRLQDGAKDALAEQIARFMHALHGIPARDVDAAGLEFSPSWQISVDLIEERLSSSPHHVIGKLLPEVVRNHKALVVADADRVFGHFDLHGANLLFDAAHTSLTGVIDFGNSRQGDLHQDISALCLSSPDLAGRVVAGYERVSGRQVSRLKVQHYATIFYLNLLAVLSRDGAEVPFRQWLAQLESWYDHLLAERARARLQAVKPLSPLTDAWRRWIASSLLGGSGTEAVQKVLRAEGFSDLDVAVEVAHAVNHPYVAAGRETAKTLKKREWLMKTCDTLAAMDGRYATEVERRTAPAFEAFVRDYYSKQLPVVLTGAVDHWPALAKWSPDYFDEKFGHVEIEVQKERDQDPLYERNAGRHKARVSMADFVRMVRGVESSNDFYMTANNMKGSVSGLDALFDDLGDFASGYRHAPTQAASSFLWFGPKGTFTPLHHDLTNNMLVQLHGRKRVTLIPSLQVPSLYNDVGVFSAARFPDFDPARHPLLAGVRKLEVELSPGEALFIPIGWWHCVTSLDVSISVSFTNFNAENGFSASFPR